MQPFATTPMVGQGDKFPSGKPQDRQPVTLMTGPMFGFLDQGRPNKRVATPGTRGTPGTIIYVNDMLYILRFNDMICYIYIYFVLNIIGIIYLVVSVFFFCFMFFMFLCFHYSLFVSI